MKPGVKRDAMGAGLAALGLYLATLQQSVSLPDSAVIMEAMQGPEISAFACNHTLNNLIGWMVCRLLPFGSLAWRCNAVSALYGAAAVGLYHALIRRLGASRLLAALCTVTLAVSHGVWWHATVVENYGLSVVAFLVCAHLVVPVPDDSAQAERRRVFALFFVAGLALLNHLQNGLLTLGCLAACIGFRRQAVVGGAAASPDRHDRPDLGLYPKRPSVAVMATGWALGAAPFLAIVAWEILSGRAGSAWGSWFLGGGGFERMMFRYGGSGGLADVARMLLWHHPGPFAVAAVGGLVWTLSRRVDAHRPLWRLVWIVVAGNVLFFLGYATWDRFSFFLVPWVAADVAAAAALARLEHRLAPRLRWALLIALAAGAALAAPFYTWQVRRLSAEGGSGWLTRGWREVRDDYRGRYDLAAMLLDPARRDRGTIDAFLRQAFAALPPGSVWVDDGSTYFQALWLQQREGLRPDIRLEWLAHPAMPGYGTAAHPLAMRRQWREPGTRWFLVANRGPLTELTDILRPFGWRAVPFPLGDQRYLWSIDQRE